MKHYLSFLLLLFLVCSCTTSELEQLQIAIVTGDTEAVSALIANGVDINAKLDDAGYTPLMSAAGNAQLEIVRLLISNGAKVNTLDDYGHTALYYSTQLAPVAAGIPEELIRSGSDINLGESVVYAAANKRFMKLVELLIENGADINKKSGSGNTPLERMINIENSPTWPKEEKPIYREIATILRNHGAIEPVSTNE